ncbi:hypothetical protein PMAYCL1PPCAC_08617, partial [Pristionchus mayeri]
ALVFTYLVYLAVVTTNIAAIIYFWRHPLKWKTFQKFIPCFYLNVIIFLLFTFDFGTIGSILGYEIYVFNVSTYCDIWFTLLNIFLLVEFLCFDQILQYHSFRNIILRAYASVLGILLIMILVRHFTIETDENTYDCFRMSVDARIVYNLVTALEIFAFFIGLSSLVLLVNLDKEESLYRIMLLLATAIEVPECLIAVFCPTDHPMNSQIGVMFRHVCYGLFQVAFVGIFFQIARNISEEPKQEVNQTSFENPSGDQIYV